MPTPSPPSDHPGSTGAGPRQKEISPGCSLEGMMLKLKLQYFGHLMQRVDSLEKTLMLGGIGGRRRRQQRMRRLDGITDFMDVSLSELQEMVLNREAWHAAVHGVTKSRTWLSDWTELNWCWEKLKVGGENDERGWDGWMASLTQWTWVWVNSKSWWWTERHDVLQSMGRRVSNWTEMKWKENVIHQIDWKREKQCLVNVSWNKVFGHK